MTKKGAYIEARDIVVSHLTKEQSFLVATEDVTHSVEKGAHVEAKDYVVNHLVEKVAYIEAHDDVNHLTKERHFLK